MTPLFALARAQDSGLKTALPGFTWLPSLPFTEGFEKVGDWGMGVPSSRLGLFPFAEK